MQWQIKYFPWGEGGVDPLGCFSVKMYAKMKELGPVGGGTPPRSGNATEANTEKGKALTLHAVTTCHKPIWLSLLLPIIPRDQ